MATPHPSRRLLLGGALTAAAVGAVASNATAAKAAPQAKAPPRPDGQTSMVGVPFAQRDTVRIGCIGLGNRGMGMMEGWTAVPGAEVVAVCDIRADRATKAADIVAKAGKPRPKEYGGNKLAADRMLRREDLDFVYIATPWEFHYDQGKSALVNGANVGIELPIATELDEIWDLVDTSEKTGRHLMLMENVSYGRNELAMLKMSHDGILGDITNGAGGYLHDLRELLFSDTYYTDAWRRKWHTRSIASLYPMHGLAPIAACMDVNRGDRLTTLTASATAAKGLAEYRERHIPKGHPSWKEEYINGDVISCLITTEQGRTIRAEHNVSSPTPYSRINSLVGSLGTIEDYPSRIYVEPDHSGHAWQDFGPWLEEYDHWLWRKVAGTGPGGHGGMDFVLQWRIVQQIRTGQVPDIDVYDSAAWCSPVPLSVASLEAGGEAVEVPDFTRGDWSKARAGLDSEETDMPS